MANEPKKTEKKKAENEPQDDWENIAEDIDITEDMDVEDVLKLALKNMG